MNRPHDVVEEHYNTNLGGHIRIWEMLVNRLRNKSLDNSQAFDFKPPSFADYSYQSWTPWTNGPLLAFRYCLEVAPRNLPQNRPNPRSIAFFEYRPLQTDNHAALYIRLWQDAAYLAEFKKVNAKVYTTNLEITAYGEQKIEEIIPTKENRQALLRRPHVVETIPPSMRKDLTKLLSYDMSATARLKLFFRNL